jgi:hypothetical protein
MMWNALYGLQYLNVRHKNVFLHYKYVHYEHVFRNVQARKLW